MGDPAIQVAEGAVMSSDTVFGASGYASADIHLFRDIAGMDRLLADFPVLRLQAGD